MKFCLVKKLRKIFLVGLVRPELKEIYFLGTFSLFLQLSLSFHPRQTLSLFLSVLHDFGHLRQPSSPARATRWSSTFGLEDPTQDQRLPQSSSPKTSRVSRNLLAIHRRSGHLEASTALLQLGTTTSTLGQPRSTSVGAGAAPSEVRTTHDWVLLRTPLSHRDWTVGPLGYHSWAQLEMNPTWKETKTPPAVRAIFNRKLIENRPSFDHFCCSPRVPLVSSHHEQRVRTYESQFWQP